MVELVTAFAVLSMFLGWRLYIVSTKLWVANTMLKGIMSGQVVVTPTDDGFELEVKKNG